MLPGYFATMRLPLVRGRDFTAADDRAAPGVVVVSESLARRYFPAATPSASASPSTLRRDSRAAGSRSSASSRDAVPATWEARTTRTIYLPYLQTTPYLDGPEGHHAYLTVVLRTARRSAALAGPARAAIWAVDRGVSMRRSTTMSEAVDRALARPRFQSTLLGAFAALALILAAGGIYGVMSYAVARRTREIGLRLTLGARRGDVLRLILSQALRRLAIGGAARPRRRLALHARADHAALRRRSRPIR